MNIPRSEYPRPRFVRKREEWVNLNGEWEFEADRAKSGTERKLQNPETSYGRKITVPFVPESKLSGICDTDFMEWVWYKRHITVNKYAGNRAILHFGAVNYEAVIFINGNNIYSHRGGYTPFCVDITDYTNDGDNCLVVLAKNDVRDPLQPSGKQSSMYHSYGCFYTRCTGIWQTVWMEYVPEFYIKNMLITPDLDNRRVRIRMIFEHSRKDVPFSAEVSYKGVSLIKEEGRTASYKTCDFEMSFPEDHDIKLWDIGMPELYDLKVNVGEDELITYFGMRKVEMDGIRFMLNGRSVFQRLVLDQGYFPDGIYTPGDVEEMKRDIERSMACGFNGARLHMKVFEPYMIYYADHMGYMIWGEYPNWGLDETLDEGVFSVFSEWKEELERDYNSPALIGWCPFNETCERRSKKMFTIIREYTKLFDPWRPFIDSSGYCHYKTDIFDVHDYDQNPQTFRERYQPLVTGTGDVFVEYKRFEKYRGEPYFVSEYGGTRWDVDESDRIDGWGYGDEPKTEEEFYQRFEGLTAALLENPKIFGLCYTQLTDVEQEKNGLYTYNRTSKFDTGRIKAIMSRRAAIEED